jgi:hypothetical protein
MHGSKLLDLLHQRLHNLHLFLEQLVRPRRPGPKDGGGPKLFKPEVLAGGGLVPGIEPLRPPAGIVFRCLEIEVLDILAYLAAEATSLVVQRAPNDENSVLERPVGLDP